MDCAAPNSTFLNQIHQFNKGHLKPTQTVEKHQTVVQAKIQPTPYGAPPEGEEVKEFFDPPEVLLQKVKKLAEMVRQSNHLVAYTGAGISTSANIPDYRGPQGVWTLKAQGKSPTMKVTLDQATPTFAHMALVKLQEEAILKYLVSTNVDGLHLRSGLKKQNLAELHGNIYKELCDKCGADYLRAFDVTKQAKLFQRFTGRLCQQPGCNGRLRDSIINFGELLPAQQLSDSTHHSKMADLALVVGTSMRVSPANKLPLMGRRLVICNLQKTPFDNRATLRIFARCDDVFKLLMKELGLEVTPYIMNSEQLIYEMENMIPDPVFSHNQPWYATRVYSMADDGPPPKPILDGIRGFDKSELRRRSEQKEEGRRQN